MNWLSRISRRMFTIGSGAVGVLGAVRALAARDLKDDFDPISSPEDVRPVVWSWTTTEQAAELRKGQALFSRASSPTLGRGYLFEVLSSRTDPVSKLLSGPLLAKGRFGWVNPWATCLGFAGERYGPELLRIELKSGAWLALVSTSSLDVNVVDLAGKAVSRKAVLGAPQRIAGVVFINDEFRFTTGARCVEPSGSASHGGTWREVYLGNIAQVANWSLGTEAILRRIEDDRALLARFSTYLAGQPPVKSDCAWQYRVSRSRWSTPQVDAVGRYEGSLAFLEAQYAPTPAGIERLAAELSARLFAPAPLTRVP